LHIDGKFEESTVALTPRSGPLGQAYGYQYVMQQQGTVARDVLALTFAAAGQKLRIWIVPTDRTPAEVILADGLTNSPDRTIPMLVLRRNAVQSRFLTFVEPVNRDAPLRAVHLAPASGDHPSYLILQDAEGNQRVPWH
jgi:hypothetical protein